MMLTDKKNIREKQTPGVRIRPHFEVVDGLRGKSAVAVVVFHFMELIYTDPAPSWSLF